MTSPTAPVTASSATLRTLQIDGMTGDACIKTVVDSLKGVAGVTHQTVQLGSATMHATDAGCASAVTAIGAAGFKAHEDKRNAGTTNPNPAGQGAQGDHKSGGRDHKSSSDPAPAAMPKPAVASH